jgi:hypothetical protein
MKKPTIAAAFTLIGKHQTQYAGSKPYYDKIKSLEDTADDKRRV